jgi:cytoskeletal protein CcmA (bactofilin family)
MISGAGADNPVRPPGLEPLMWNRETSTNDTVRQAPSMPPLTTANAATRSDERRAVPEERRVVPEERRQVAWVGKSVVFKGELTSSEDMTIDGRIEGTIEVSGHALTIGPDADIRAEIVASTVSIRGKVTGTISADQMVELCATASIEGDIFTPRLAIADGAMVQGRVDTSGQASAKHSRPRLKTVV